MKRVLAAATLAFLFLAAVYSIESPRQAQAQYAPSDTTTLLPKLNFGPTGQQGAGIVRRDTSRTIYIEGASNLRMIFSADSAITCSTMTYQVSNNDTTWINIVANNHNQGLALADGVGTSTAWDGNPRVFVYPAFWVNGVDLTLGAYPIAIPIHWRFFRVIVLWETTTNYNHAMRSYVSIYKPWNTR